jgi:death-on-curing protein
MIYLELEALLLIARRTLGAEPKVRDFGLLSSALARPATHVFGREVYPNLATKAAALLHSLVSNHALVDGNKRLGWQATVTFCDLNGSFLDLPDDRAYELVTEIASGERTLVEYIAEELSEGLRPNR